MKFCIVNLGCKVNRVESDATAALLIDQGGQPVALEDAELIVVNTCSVTGEAEKKTRKALRRALRDNNQASVVVTGCASALNPAFYEQFDERVHVIHKSQLFDELSRSTTAFDPCLRTGPGFPTRVGVKVQDGCDNACTFCVVHTARGRAVSRPSSEIIEECVALARAGVKEIVLTGINLGSYRERDAYNNDDLRLDGLLRLLLDATVNLQGPDEPPCRFRISSIEPRDIDDDLIDLLVAEQGRICRHLHLPLQSGSSKVLHEMARPYDAVFYAELVGRLRRAYAGISLSTDVIVGFPGETENDYHDTLSMCSSCGFSKIHVFPFSRREGTVAAARSDQVPSDIKTARARVLRNLGEDLRKADFQRRSGTIEYALVEENGFAMTESYYEVTPPQSFTVGSLVQIKL